MQNDMLFDLVVCIRDALSKFIDKHDAKTQVEDEPEDEGLDVDMYLSDNTPNGYETVLSYLAKYQPGTIECLVDPVRDTLGDGVTLSHRAKKAKLDIIKVRAPIIANGAFSTLNAYPVHLLRKFYEYR